MQTQPNHRLSAIVAALTLCASAPSFAGGELLDIELPSMRTPIAAVAPAAPGSAVAAAAQDGLTRDEVRAELQTARAAGLLSAGGEGSDSTQLLLARDSANAAQAETLMAGYRAELARALAQQQVEALRAAIETASAATATLALLADDETAAGVRIDVVELASLSTLADRDPDARPDLLASRPERVLIVAIPGPDSALQRREMRAIRQRLTQLGVPRREVYAESEDS